MINIRQSRFFQSIARITEVKQDSGVWLRRGRILNVILLAFFALSIVSGIANWGYKLSGMDDGSVWLTFYVLLATIFSTVGLYYVNTYKSVKPAAATFLLILIILIFLADEPFQTIWGRNMIPLALPIIMAGLIMQPSMSFVAAIVISIGSLILAFYTNQLPNIFGVVTYLILALISWLTTGHLENAVDELHVTNRELDDRVMQRTEELAVANELLDEERKFLEQRVIERTAEISEINAHLIRVARVKDEFLANMSHELRTPLNAIIGYSEGIIEEIEEDTETILPDYYLQDVTNILTAGHHLLSIINDILDISKLEANQTTFQISTIEIDELINKLLISVSPAVKAQNNALKIVNDCPDQCIVSDELKLTQILLNLLSNSAKFTKDGTIEIKIEPNGIDRIKFSVSDTGIGIPQTSIEQIFLPFRQVENGTTRSFDGSGLGLAISSKLATILGGKIAVESTLGVGSTFILDLPKEIDRLMTKRGLNAKGLPPI